MAAYTVDDREKLLLRMPGEVKDKIKELSDAQGISMTAMLNIVILYGIDVHELLQEQKATAAAIIAATSGKR